MSARTKEPKALSSLNQQMQVQYADIIDFLKTIRRLDENNYLYQIRYRIINVMQYMETSGHTSIIDATYEDYLEYIQSLGSVGRSTYRMHMDAIKKINEWMYHKGHAGPENLTKLSLIKTPKAHRRPDPDPFSDAEISQIFQNIDTKFPYDPLGVDKLIRGLSTSELDLRKSLMNKQLKALAWLMLETGMRVNEAYHLTVEMVDPINESIYLTKTKFNKPREVPYSDLLRKEITVWLAHRKLVAPNTDNLWVALWGTNLADDSVARPVQYPSFYEWIDYMMGENTVTMNQVLREGKGRWHRFRKTFATRSQSLGLDIGVTSKVLGHEDTRTTMIYLGIDKQRIIAEARSVEQERADAYMKAIAVADQGRDDNVSAAS
jgi:integrase